jgi:hypothetical protein
MAAKLQQCNVLQEIVPINESCRGGSMMTNSASAELTPSWYSEQKIPHEFQPMPVQNWEQPFDDPD